MSSDSPHVVLACGQPYGVDVGLSGNPATQAFLVRLGADTFPLTEDLAVCWLAGQRGELTGARLGEHAALLRHLHSLGVRDPRAVWTALTDRGLLLSYAGDPTAIAQFAATVALHPLMIGLGADPDEPGSYLLGYPGGARYRTSAATFYLCTAARLYRSLLEAVIDLSDRIQIGRSEYEPDRSAAQLLTSFFDELPSLLAAGAVYLDCVRHDGRGR